MSLLLDALKKAEAAKQSRQAAHATPEQEAPAAQKAPVAAEPVAEITPAAIVEAEAPPPAIQFEALDFPTIGDSSPVETAAASTEPAPVAPLSMALAPLSLDAPTPTGETSPELPPLTLVLDDAPALSMAPVDPAPTDATTSANTAPPRSDSDAPSLAEAASRLGGGKRSRPPVVDDTPVEAPAPQPDAAAAPNLTLSTPEPKAKIEPTLEMAAAPASVAETPPTPRAEAAAPPAPEPKAAQAAATTSNVKQEQAAAKRLLSSKQTAAATITPQQKRRLWILIGVASLLVLAGGGGYFWLQLNEIGSSVVPKQAAVTPTPITTQPATAPAEPAPATPPPAATESAAPPANTTPAQTGTQPDTADKGKPSTSNSKPPAPEKNKPSKVEPPAAKAKAPLVPADIAGAESKSGSGVHFSKKAPSDSVPRLLSSGWQAFQDGNYAQASSDYRQQLSIDPQSRDAQLGLAAIAVRQGRNDEARKRYQQLLNANPRDEVAKAALASLSSDENPAQAERRLQQMLAEDANPATATALGSLYAKQGRWSEAQQYYFRAFSTAPKVADYAYNLAVSLDNLNQPVLAADYYAKALSLPGNATFDKESVKRRIEIIRENYDK